MSHDVIWTKQNTEIFIEEGQLTDEQIFILKTMIKKWTIIQQAEYLHTSVSTINRRISDMRKLYDACAKNNPLLIPRKQKGEK